MCALKYSTGRYGQWRSDGDETLRFALSDFGVQQGLNHAFVAGAAIVHCDSRGGCRISASPGWAAGGGLIPWLGTANGRCHLAPPAWNEERFANVQVGFTPSGMVYEGQIRTQTGGKEVRFEFRVWGAPGMPGVCFALELDANPGMNGVQDFGVSWILPENFLRPSPDSTKPTGFVKDNAVVLGHAEASLDDAFLGVEAGAVENRGDRLVGARVVSDDTEECLTLRGCLGFVADGSIRFVHQTIDAMQDDGAFLRTSQNERLNSLRFPEIWMRDEFIWTTASTAVAAVQAQIQNATILDETRLRETLLALPALSAVEPTTAEQVLRQLTGRLTACGRFPVWSNDKQATDRTEFLPECDGSDLEILLLSAWAVHCSRGKRTAFAKTAENDDADDAVVSSASALNRCARWIRDQIGTGHGDLLRIGRRDVSPLTCGAGVEGRGSSLVNTAMLVYAVSELQAAALSKTGCPVFDDDVVAFAQNLTVAVNENGIGPGWFVRGFLDDGGVIGADATTERMFLDAQAWALIARCGAASDRMRVADRLVDAMKTVSPGLPSVIPPLPYDARPDAAMSDTWTVPGAGWNGGFSALLNGWTVWALLRENRVGIALECWERQCLRRLMAEFDCALWPEVDEPAALASSLAAPVCFPTGSCIGQGAEDQPRKAFQGIALWSAFGLHSILVDFPAKT